MQKATIRWFDGQRGEGMVRLENGESVYVHFTAFYTPSDRNFHYPTSEAAQDRLNEIFHKDAPVEVEITRDSHYTQVSKIIPIL